MNKLGKQAAKLSEQIKNDKFMIAYTYFIKNYYELRAELEIQQKTGKHNKKKIEKLQTEINRAQELLNIDVVKFGAADLRNIYKNHKSIMKKWTNKTPRKKIINTLESWTGESGENAVIETIYNMQHNSQELFGKMLGLHGFIELTNTNIKAAYYNMIYTLFKYYINHRDKYFESISSKKVKINNSGISFGIIDDFANIKIKLHTGNLQDFGKSIELLIQSINKLDTKILCKVFNEITAVENKEIIYIRRDLKKKIIDSANDIAEEIKTYNEDINIDISKSKESVGGLIELVKDFINAEKEVEKNLDLVKENLEFQIKNMEQLQIYINSLCGPDTIPCILRIAPSILAELQKDDKNFKSNKLTAQGEKKLSEFI